MSVAMVAGGELAEQGYPRCSTWAHSGLQVLASLRPETTSALEDEVLNSFLQGLKTSGQLPETI